MADKVCICSADKAPPLQKVIMVIEVDLNCCKCRRKIKKVLCSIPQVQNQVYDEKSNTVTITVVCCCPEKIKQKICCKGGESVKGIEILKPPRPKQKPTGKQEPEKPPTPQTPPPEKTRTEKPPEPQPPPPKKQEPEKPPKTQPTPPPTAPPTWCPPPPAPLPWCPPPSRPYCCAECYHGIEGGPCYWPPPRYEGCGRPVYDSWGSGVCGGNRTYYVCRADYFSEENPSGCMIM